MKKYFFLIYLLVSLSAKAQVDISLNEPISNQLKLADMFNIVITNSSGADMQVSLEGILKTRKGDMVVRGVTGTFSIKTGVSFINPISLSIQYTFYKQNIQSGSDIPYGEYVLCCTLIDRSTGANQCIEMNIHPLTPPFLTYPENGAKLEDGQVNFIWQSPAPIKRNQVILYDLTLVKLLPNQTCSQAITMNSKELFERNLNQSQLNYPLSAIPLDTGFSYCWQVKAKTDEYSIGETEVWMFRMIDPLMPLPSKPLPFIVLKRETDAAVYESENGKLNFMFQEPYQTNNFKYEIINLKYNTILTTDCLKNGFKKYGDNQYVFDFSSCNISNGLYKLVIYNEKNEGFSVKFKVK